MARKPAPTPQPDPMGGGYQPPQPGPAPQGYPQQGYPQQGYGPGGLPPGYEIKKKKRFYKKVWFWLLVIVVVIIIIIATAISSAVKDATSKPHTVLYKVTGTGPITKADVSYYTSDGSNNSSNISQDGQSLPFTKMVTVKGDLSGFVLTANTPIAATTSPKGTLSCSLSVDGKVVSTDHSSGSVSLVTCSGSGYNGK